MHQTILLGCLCCLLWATPADAKQFQLKYTEVLDCTITRIKGRFSSYLPPRKGDSITIDLSKKTLSLWFTYKGNKRGMIPTPNLKQKKPGDKWRQHQAFYITDKNPGDPTMSAQLIVGKYGRPGDPLHKGWSAVIQKLRKNAFSTWTLDEAHLSCTLRNNNPTTKPKPRK